MTVRVFIRPLAPPEPGQTFELDDAERHYASRVRRVRTGDTIEVLDGHGDRWTAIADQLDPKRCTVRLLERRPTPNAVPSVVVLGLPEPAAALEAIARCCELAVTEIALVRCQLSQAGAPGPGRINRVLEASQRQCGRPRPPSIVDLSFEQAVAHRSDLEAFVAAPGADRRPDPTRLDRARAGFRVFIGPEGGFAAHELSQLDAAGVGPIGLGPWILRTEVATVAAVSTLSALTNSAED